MFYAKVCLTVFRACQAYFPPIAEYDFGRIDIIVAAVCGAPSQSVSRLHFSFSFHVLKWSPTLHNPVPPKPHDHSYAMLPSPMTFQASSESMK